MSSPNPESLRSAYAAKRDWARGSRTRLDDRSGFLGWARSAEFKLIFTYLRARIPSLMLISILSILRSVVEGLGGVMLLALIQLLIGGSARLPGSMNLLGINVTIPFLPTLGPERGTLVSILGLLLGLLVFFALMSLAQAHMTNKIGLHFVEEVRRDVLDKMLDLDIAYFTEVKSGDIAYLQNARIGRCSVLLKVAEGLFSSVLSLAVLTFLLARLFPLLTGLLVILALVLSFLMRGMQRRLQVLSTEAAEQSSLTASIFLETVLGIRLVKMAALEGRARDKYHAALREWVNRTLGVRDHGALANGLTRLGVSFALAVSAFAFSKLSKLSLAQDMGLTMGYFAIAGMAFMHVQSLLQQRLHLASLYGEYMPVAEFLLDDSILDRQADTSLNERAPLHEIRDSLSVESVCFGYDNHDVVLDDVSLEFRKGTITALVGLSGAGKSTLLELLARFRYPMAGRVLVDGLDVQQYGLASFRSRVGYVAQETIIFNDTILENIRYLRPDATEAEAEQAARMAMAHEFIVQGAHGYQAIAGERGLKLSGGQRQRIALTRVFLRDPEVILLDEATNAVDLYTEAKIFETLMKLKDDKIIVVAAHRLSAITRFDNIVVIHNGRVLEQGTHEELVKHQSLYYNLFKLQEYSPESGLASLIRP